MIVLDTPIRGCAPRTGPMDGVALTAEAFPLVAVVDIVGLTPVGAAAATVRLTIRGIADTVGRTILAAAVRVVGVGGEAGVVVVEVR